MTHRFFPRRRFIVIALLCVAGMGSSLEISQGKIKLVIHEPFERFILYTRFLAGGSGRVEWAPLMVDKDPRTSYVTLRVNDNIYRLGSIPGVRARIGKGPEGGIIHWVFPELEVKQTFSFLRSKESTESDALRIMLEVTNLKDVEISLGVRYTLDTYLGERSSIPFRTGGIPAITRETTFVPDGENWFILSEDPERNIGMQILLRGEGVTPVERVVVANWRRLSDSPWEYPVNPTRSFTLLPYSINDSAIALYYPTLPLKSRETRRIVTVLGNKGSGAYLVDGSYSAGALIKPDLDALLHTSREGETSADFNAKLLAELSRVEEFIDRISKRVSDSTPVSKEELEVYRKVLEELTKRSKSPEKQ
ncbi:MAG: hypothetical protein N2442_05105 [Spirochaetes bacterium]|nr:hypothetical protein [Spirochaetota bacterium]